LSDDELRVYLEGVDRSVARIGAVEGDPFALAANGPGPAVLRNPLHEVDRKLVRSSLRSMLVTSSVATLPEGNRNHPESRNRLKKISAESDFAVLGTLAALESMTSADHAEFDEELKSSPDCVEEIVQMVDRHAVETGVSNARRRHLKRMARHAAWQLRNRGSEHTVRQAVSKVHRRLDRALRDPQLSTKTIAADEASTAYWREWTVAAYERFAPPPLPEASEQPEGQPAPESDTSSSPGGSGEARRSRESLEAEVQRLEEENRRAKEREIRRLQGENEALRKETASSKSKKRPSKRKPTRAGRKAGATMLGFGLMFTVLGLAFIPLSGGWSAIALTPGVILLVLGIIWLARNKGA
jgi:hypothetical protein